MAFLGNRYAINLLSRHELHDWRPGGCAACTYRAVLVAGEGKKTVGITECCQVGMLGFAVGGS